ncbi:MAG: RNA polymerase sigma factor [Mariniblastus sp.]
MTSTSTHGTSLIVRLKDNDTGAWNEMVELYAPLIFHWCVQRGLQSSDAADIMQEVFSKAASAVHQFQSNLNGSLRGWLWVITQNKIRDFWRKQNHQVNSVGGTEANLRFSQLIDSHNQTQDDELTGELENTRFLYRALEQIKVDFQPNTWKAFWRTTVDGVETSAVAKELGLSQNSIRQAKSRVLRRLREQLGEV